MDRTFECGHLQPGYRYRSAVKTYLQISFIMLNNNKQYNAQNISTKNKNN